MNVLANVIGFLGIGANVLIYQQKTGKKLLILKLISDVLWAIHYLFIGAYSAVVIATVGILRESVFFNQDKKWAKSRLWLLFFVFVSVVGSIFTWKGIFSLFPMFASVISVISFGLNKPYLSRILALPISFFMMTYDIVFSSYMGILNECFTLTSTVIALIRYSRV